MAIITQFSPLPVAVPTAPPRPAGNAPESRPTSPSDSYGGPVGAPNANPLQFMQEQSQRAALVDRMLVADGPGRPSATEAAGLRSTLTRVDTDVLRFAQRGGVSIGVVHPGDDFNRLGVLQPRSAQQYQELLPQMRSEADRAVAATADVDRRLGEVRSERAALGNVGFASPFGFWGSETPTPQQAQAGRLDARIGALELERGRVRSDALGQDPMAIPFSIPTTVGAPPQAALMQLQLTRMPKGTDLMAAMVGARTPDQVAEYNRLVEGINGERLTQARADGLRTFEAGISQLPADQQEGARQRLAAMRENPSMVPIDTEAHNILVPNLFFAPDGQGGTQRLTLHDAQTLSDWADPNGRARPAWSPEEPGGSVVEGQHFRANGRVLVRDRQVAGGAGDGHGDTPIHELGHGIEHLVRIQDPKFYSDWHSRLEAAHQTAVGPPFDPHNPRPLQEHPGTVSSYAETNPGEYIAEGIAHYYDDPRLLQTRDPALYTLTEQLLQRAGELGRR